MSVRLKGIVSLFGLTASLKLAYLSGSAQAQTQEWPIRDTETGDKTVQWDHYSLILNGTRLISFGGEFHPFRIPVPEVWLDILEKMKAIGFNTMSFYNSWGYHSPYPNVVDFETGAHDLERLYKMSKDVGLWVSARPGPYANAELNAGGLALWTTTGAYGLRDNSTTWTSAWEPYMKKFDEITAKYQVTQNGTVLLYQIENEFPEQWTDVASKIPKPVPIAYMKNLFNFVQNSGIVVPITHNMPGPKYKSWSVDYDTVGAGGNVHIYGLDNYPSCWSCIPEDCSSSNPSFTLMDYTAHFNEVSPKQPSSMPEFQGGAVNPWYGPVDGCRNKTDERFVSLYYRDNLAQRVTMLNLYMLYGGTNWGAIGAPFQQTSYDYSAAISENRTIGNKFYEMKNLARFTRIAHDLAKTDLVGTGTTYTETEGITANELRNPDTDAGFYAIRPTDPTAPNDFATRITIKTSSGNVTVPRLGGSLSLKAHYAKILTTDFRFGDVNLLYSTAEILSYAFFDGKPSLVLWVFDGEDGEFAIEGARSGNVLAGDKGKVKFEIERSKVTVNFKGQTGATVIELDNSLKVQVLDKSTAYRFWVPALTADPRVPEDQVVFVHGPHLVRRAYLKHDTLLLEGDSDQETAMEIYTTKAVKRVKWNGKHIDTNETKTGGLRGVIEGPKEFKVPAFGAWKSRDTLPERATNYQDSGPAWVHANHTTTTNKYKDATKPYLYSDDYGFHNGIHLWRGRFHGTASGVYIRTQGGVTHGWSAYLNGHFLQTNEGTMTNDTASSEIAIPANITTRNENVLLIVQDNAGHDQLSRSQFPRGIVNATLLGSGDGFQSWSLAGTAGRGIGRDIDPVRTQYSQGGLFGERLGWHLNGFDDSDWDASSPGDLSDEAGIRFFRTNLNIDAPQDHDISLSISLDFNAEETSNKFRAYLYVNGYEYGKYFPYMAGGRKTYPVPPGIWNYQGDNAVSVVVWNLYGKPVRVDVGVDVNYVLASSFQSRFDSQYLRPEWTEDRLKYA
ncbi:unnamed protein product [Clonostachys rosea]|uniref:beta-galactosidase n=1 Tax=Bionectria ochroleuca TaxID=29856 RepID=A0ABY6V0M9_BIOOC|nr:unnamed protein product [Clonostachys rosea]